MFSCQFFKNSKNTFFTEHLWTTEIPTATLQEHLLSENWLWYALSSVEIFCQNFRESQVEQPKQLLHLKKSLAVKFLRLSVQFGFLESISHNPMFSNHSLKKEAGMKFCMHIWLHICQHSYFPFFSNFFFQIILILGYFFFYLFRLCTLIISLLNSSKQ